MGGIFQTEGVERKKLSGVFDVLGESVNKVFENKMWLWLLKSQLAIYALSILAMLPMLVVIVMLIVAITAVGDASFNWTVTIVSLVLMGITLFVMPGFTEAYFTKMFVEAYKGNQPGIGDMLKEAFKNRWKYFGLSLVVGLIIFGGMLLLVIPGIVWSLMYTMVFFAMYDQKLGGGQARKESKRLTAGYKWELFKKFLGVGLVTAIVSGITSGMLETAKKSGGALIVSLIAIALNLVLGAVSALVYIHYYFELKEIKKKA